MREVRVMDNKQLEEMKLFFKFQERGLTPPSLEGIRF